MTRHARFALALSVLASLLALGCSPNLFHTEVNGETTIQGSVLGGVLNTFPTVGNFANLDFNENQDFKNQQASKSQVTSVKVESIKLILEPGWIRTSSFLDNLQFFARSGDDETLIAEKNAIAELGLAAPNPVLAMDVNAAELRKHVAAPTMSIIVRGRGRSPPKDTGIETTVALKVDLKLF